MNQKAYALHGWGMFDACLNLLMKSMSCKHPVQYSINYKDNYKLQIQLLITNTYISLFCNEVIWNYAIRPVKMQSCI